MSASAVVLGLLQRSCDVRVLPTALGAYAGDPTGQVWDTPPRSSYPTRTHLLGRPYTLNVSRITGILYMVGLFGCTAAQSGYIAARSGCTAARFSCTAARFSCTAAWFSCTAAWFSCTAAWSGCTRFPGG